MCTAILLVLSCRGSYTFNNVCNNTLLFFFSFFFIFCFEYNKILESSVTVLYQIIGMSVNQPVFDQTGLIV